MRNSILVVDDDVDTCDNLFDILTDLGYRVDTAHDGPSALELVQKNAYAIALLDFKMPGMDGLALYREIKKLRSGTVAIIITAYVSQDTEESARGAGAWKILPKPVNLPQLLPLVDEALRQPLVLVVDDDSDLCATLWDLFRERNYRVCVAHSASQAQDRLAQDQYNVVLVDLKLPEGDGGEVLRAVRRKDPAARTILITGYSTELKLLIEQAMAEGANAVCYKPFDVERLLDTLQRLTRESETSGRSPAS
jgi:two-component system, NtrC family, response regulator HydG